MLYQEDDFIFGDNPKLEELENIEKQKFDENLEFDENLKIEDILKNTYDETMLVENDPIAYCKAQEIIEGGVKTHGLGIKDSDREIPIGYEKYIPTNDFKGI